MNKLFKFLVFILVIEILLGYLFYLQNSTILTGHYVSSTIQSINKVINSFDKHEVVEKKTDAQIENVNKIKEKEEEIVLKQNENKCQTNLNTNQHVKLSGIEALRRQLDIQTDLEFLNFFDQQKHFLVVLTGNSETFGMHQDFEKRLHILLQEKLRDEFQSKDIFVVNASYLGGMVSDHLRDLLIFSLFYKPDLSIIYSGGNELKLKHKYEKITKKVVIDKAKFTSLDFYKNELLLPHNIRYCLKNIKFLTEENFQSSNSIVDYEAYMKFHFKKIKETFNEKSIEFMFYVQPLSLKLPEPDLPISQNYPKMMNLDIQDSKFNNLNLRKISGDLDFVDSFHTRDASQIADILLRDIIKEYKNKIMDKIN